MVEQSLLHITLNMNHRRRSPRSEVSQEAIDLLSVLIQKSEFPIPARPLTAVTYSSRGAAVPASSCSMRTAFPS